MKFIALFLLVVTFLGNIARADYFSPFIDAKVGATVTSTGVIVVDTHSGSAPAYFVRFRTDTGPRDIPAEIPSELSGKDISGRRAKITVIIREREDVNTKAKIRFLEVLRIDFDT
ncbi:MAG: hypothetical protein QM790_16430 [Nibricoccus sp.]